MIFSGLVSKEINFNALINLVSVCNSQDKNVIWGFLKEYDKKLNPKTDIAIDNLIGYAINYYTDFVLPVKKYKILDLNEKPIFQDLYLFLKNVDKSLTSEEIQTQIYEIGKKYKFNKT